MTRSTENRIKRALLKFDIYLFRRVFGLNGRKAIDAVLYLISRSGDGYLYLLIGLVLFLINNASSEQFIFAALAAFAFGLPVQKILKHQIKRIRPFEKIEDIFCLIAPPDRYSFPSGHTSHAFLMANLLSEVYPGAKLPLLTWAGFVGFSRVYLGVHYPTDVLAGMVLGLVSSYIGINLMF